MSSPWIVIFMSSPWKHAPLSESPLPRLALTVYTLAILGVLGSPGRHVSQSQVRCMFGAA